MSFAAKRGIISAIKDLLDKKADIECDTRLDGYSPLGHAVNASQRATVNFLLENGASVNREMANGMTPLVVAAETGDQELIDFLVKKHAHVDFETSVHENA